MATSILVLLASGAMQAAQPAAPRTLPPEAAASLARLISCTDRLQRVAEAQELRLRPHERLVGDPSERYWATEPTNGEVRLVYLLERRIDGCSVPLAPSVRLEEAERPIARDLARPRR